MISLALSGSYRPLGYLVGAVVPEVKEHVSTLLLPSARG